ncbi:M50 family metallopeptidase [Ilumatobacter sp.]|uniref:M50 family metallopeptidase n=1 Tax=Ilumatobacter sp. TaxID=1967498 RepID=UPI003AF829C8
MTTDELPAPPPPPQQHGRFTSEVMAGGSVVEKADDELVGGVRGAIGVIAVVGLIALLGLFSIWWLVFVVGVLVAIFLHETGHFVTARWTGMKATQFFIGFGPRLWSFRRGETEYGVRALPLGAFVRIIGMNNMDDVEPGDEDRTYRSKSYPKRMLVISAGSIMHMLIAIVLLFVVYVADGETFANGAEIGGVEAAGPAAVAGLMPGDVVQSIDGRSVEGSGDLGRIVQANEPQESVEMVVVRDGEAVALNVTLGSNVDEESPLFGKPYIGVSSSTYFDTIEHSVPAAAANAVTDIFPTSWEMTKGAVKVLNPVNIFTHVAGTNDDIETRPTTLVGVTGLSDDVGEAQGIVGILFLLAVLNVFVGVFNMFPLLPLDGGHAAIATYERVRERGGERYYADVAKLMPFAMAVMMVLMFLFMSGLYLDITDPVG